MTVPTPRTLEGIIADVLERIVAVERRLARRLGAGTPTQITELATAGMTVGAEGVSVVRSSGWTHIRGRINRTGSETGLAFVLPELTWPAEDEFGAGFAGAATRVGLQVTVDGQLLVTASASAGSFVFSLSFPAA
jgi:hypothetical protein